ncbi:MAG: phosphoribosylformylglycinamidine synthase subunit PurQ [Acidobacteriota bacterium]
MKCGVVVFPGSNCDHDARHVLREVLGQPVTSLWHADDTVDGCELVVLPGGFSYGDYLRAGAMAASAPVMQAVRRHADAGGWVLGVCNGFQILLEAGLLPGALARNRDLRFVCRDVHLRVERDDTPFTRGYEIGQTIRLPIAHAEGRYVNTDDRLDALEDIGGVVFRYADADGQIATDDDPRHNPNGSSRAIAGIATRRGHVLGMMPHPERASEALLGNDDGRRLFAAAVGAALDEPSGAAA